MNGKNKRAASEFRILGMDSEYPSRSGGYKHLILIFSVFGKTNSRGVLPLFSFLAFRIPWVDEKKSIDPVIG